MGLQDTVKADAAKVEAEVKVEATSFFAKTFTGKTLAIVAVVSFVVGLLVHLL